MTIHKNKPLAKMIWPALVLSAALSLPAESFAAPSPDRGEKAERAEKNQNKGQGQGKARKQEARQDRQRNEVRQEKKARGQERREVGSQRAAERREARQREIGQQRAAERRQEARNEVRKQNVRKQNDHRQAERQAEIRRQADLRRAAERQHALNLQNQRQAEIRRQAEIQRQTDLRRAAERERAIALQNQRNQQRSGRYATPIYRDGRRSDNRAYANRGQRRYGRGYSNRDWQRGDDTMVVDGYLTNEGYECQAVRDDNGHLYMLIGNTYGLRTGDHVRLTGWVVDGGYCNWEGTAFEVEDVKALWGDRRHQTTLYHHQYDGSQFGDRDRWAGRRPRAFQNRADRSGGYYDGRGARNDGGYRDNGRYNDDDYDGRYADDGKRQLIIREGRLYNARGGCPTLVTGDGEFPLQGDLRGHGNGDRVKVVGFLAGQSRCGGQAIQVGEISGR